MYQFKGLIIGLCSFIIIGVFHPIVIKGEYYFGKKIWPFFLLSGIIFIIVSINIASFALSAISAVIGFTCFWSIHELFEQEKRVRKGWFPKNPNRNNE